MAKLLSIIAKSLQILKKGIRGTAVVSKIDFNRANNSHLLSASGCKIQTRLYCRFTCYWWLL